MNLLMLVFVATLLLIGAAPIIALLLRASARPLQLGRTLVSDDYLRGLMRGVA